MARGPFPGEGAAVPDSPKLTLVVMSPEEEWSGDQDDNVRARGARWTRSRDGAGAQTLAREPRQAPEDLKLTDCVRVEVAEE